MRLRHRWFLLSSLFSALLAALLFIPGLSGGFVLDDEPNIVANYAIHMETLDPIGLLVAAFSHQPGGVTRILPTASFALDYWRGGGLDPAVFKATNIAIHALTTFVLAWLFRTLLLATAIPAARARLAAPALALAWAMHPLQVSSVLYVVQRMQTMATLFLVLALLAYLKARLAQVEGCKSRNPWLLVMGFWLLAIGCKEDAILLPAYTLALELTVLRFRAASPALAGALRRGYQLIAAIGAAIVLLVVVPHFWHWDAYPSRDFSTLERLLTQGRALTMYLWEILLPLPRHMPFYYDWLQPSRGLFDPWTTLPALLLLFGLLASAWRLRTRRPLFALGVMLFFAGHFVTSNVLNLELAFEHRNHFPLIGIVLAAGDLLSFAARRLQLRPVTGIAVVTLLLMLLGGATWNRATSWSSPLALARTSTELAPNSARAWNLLGRIYFEMGGAYAPGNPYLDEAIEASDKGAERAPYATSNLTNLIILKSLQGSATRTDWDRYLARLQQVVMGHENQLALRTLMNNFSHGVALDEDRVLEAIDIIARRGKLHPSEFATIGYFILDKTHQPERAYPYFARSIRASGPGTRLTREIITRLRAQDRAAWADHLEALARHEMASQDRR